MAQPRTQIRIQCTASGKDDGCVEGNGDFHAVTIHPTAQEYIIPYSDNITATQVRIADNGEMHFHQRSDGNDNFIEDTDARVLADFRVSVATDASLGLRQERYNKMNLLTVPPSTHTSKTVIYIRSEDTVCFTNEGLRLLVRVEDAGAHLSGSQNMLVASSKGFAAEENFVTAASIEGIKSEVVQVESSNVEPQDDVKDDEVEADAETEHEEDLVQPRAHSSTNPGRAQGTPRKAEELVPTVKETPDHQSVWHEEPTFSTAPVAFDGTADQPFTNASLDKGIESPSMRAQNVSLARTGQPVNEDSQFRAESNLLQSIHGTQSSENTEDRSQSEDEITTPIPPRKRYSRKDRNARYMTEGSNGLITNGNTSNEPHIAEHENVDLPTELSAQVATALNGTTPVPALTSDDVGEQSVRFEATSRTVHLPRTMKRKSSTPESEPSVEKLASSKRRKTDSSFASVSSQEGIGAFGAISLPNTDRSIRKNSIPSSINQDELADSGSADEIIVSSEHTSSRKKGTRNSPKVLVGSPSKRNSSNNAKKVGNQNKISKLVLSRITLKKGVENWLKANGIQILDDVPTRRTNFVCVVQAGELTKTPKVLRSLIFGKPVVTEEWLQKSKEFGDLIDVEAFVHIDVGENRGKAREALFTGKTLLFTNALVQQYGTDGWADIQAIAKAAGSSNVRKCSVGRDGPKTSNDCEVIFVGSDHSDDDVSSLTQNHKRTVHHKDFLTHSIVSGTLDLDDERFHLHVGTAPKGRGKK